MASDTYVEKLKEVITNLENIYGLRETNTDGIPFVRTDIDEVLLETNKKVTVLSSTQRAERNAQAGRQSVLLHYLNHRLRFFNKIKLDFKEYPRTDEIAKILLQFLKKKTIGEDSIRDLNKIVIIMKSIDEKYVQYKMGLAYRYLRIFIVMVVHGNYCNAGIVADFILNQLMLGVEG